MNREYKINSIKQDYESLTIYYDFLEWEWKQDNIRNELVKISIQNKKNQELTVFCKNIKDTDLLKEILTNQNNQNYLRTV